MQLNNQ